MTPGCAPPTAGLPLRLRDLVPGGTAPLGPALARWLGLDAVQIECSGTAALVVALIALHEQAPSRHEVVVPAYTCPLVALAVAHCGLQLRVCDLVPDGLDMDPAHLGRLCCENTLAIMPTHLGGRLSDVRHARACATAVGAWVIEDAAQALGATVQGRCVGADSDMVFFSLAVGKGLTLYEGGVLHVRDPQLRESCRRISARIAPRRIGWEMLRCLQLLGLGLLYRPALLPWAYGRPLRSALRRADWIAAAGEDFAATIPLHQVGPWRQAVGARALQRLPAFQVQTASLAQDRLRRLRGIAGLLLLSDDAGVDAQGVWPVLLMLLPNQACRDDVLQRLWGAGCGVSVPFVHALPDHPACASLVPTVDADAWPNARRLAGRLLCLSNSAWLTPGQFDTVCAALQAAAQPAADSRDRSAASRAAT